MCPLGAGAAELRARLRLQEYERMGTAESAEAAAPAATGSQPGATSKSTEGEKKKKLTKIIWPRVVALALLVGLLGSLLDLPAKLTSAWDFFFPPSSSSEPYPQVSASASAKPVPSPASTGVVWHAGWGPSRDTFTCATPPAYAVLNSITDHPHVGDERNFVRVRQAGEDTYTDYLRVQPGDNIELSVFYANDAADNLDGSAATIHGLEAEFYFPPAGKDTGLSVTLSGKNVAGVWDGATVLSDVPVDLHPVAGTLRALTGAASWNIDIGDRLDAVTLGWEKSDGELPVGKGENGEARGYGYLTVELDVVAAD